jgi:hypothetical protein
MREPEIYEGLRQFRRVLDQTVAVLNFLLDNRDFEQGTTPEEIKGLIDGNQFRRGQSPRQ